MSSPGIKNISLRQFTQLRGERPGQHQAGRVLHFP
jgi:hypothetical protein